MDPVHDRGSMDPVHESGPWTWSKVGVHGPLVHVLSSPPTVVRAEAITGMKQQLRLFILVLNNKCNNYIREGPLEWPLQRILSTLSKGRQGCAVRKI